MKCIHLLALFIGAIMLCGCLASPYRTYRVGELEVEYPVGWSISPTGPILVGATMMQEPSEPMGTPHCFIEAVEIHKNTMGYPPGDESDLWSYYDAGIKVRREHGENFTTESGPNWRKIILIKPAGSGYEEFKLLWCSNRGYSVRSACPPEKAASWDLARHGIESARCMS